MEARGRAIIRRMDAVLIGLLIGVPLVAGLVALLSYVKRTQRAERQTMEDVWRAFSKAEGLRLHTPDPRVFAPQGFRAVGDTGGVKITLAAITRQDGDDTERLTQLTATCSPPLLFEGKIYSELPLAGLWRALGAQDVETGDAAFDERFTVKASSESAMRELLGEEVRSALLAFDEPVVVSIDDGALTVTWRGHETRRERLDEALTLARCITAGSSPPVSPTDDASEPARRPSKNRRERG